MKVLFDLRMCNWSGIGRYSSNLFCHLAGLVSDEDFRLSALTNERESIPINVQKAMEDKKINQVKTIVEPFSFRNFLGFNLNISREVDLLHIPHFTAPLLCPKAVVVTIHDLIPLRYPVISRKNRFIYYHWNNMAVKKAKLIIAISKFTAEVLHNTFNTSFSKIEVIYEAPDPFFKRKPMSMENVENNYFLAFGNFKYHKGIDVLLKAFYAANTSSKLILVGSRPDISTISSDLAKIIMQLEKSDRLKFAGRVSDEELLALYANSLGYIHPSREEGFGLPPLEAMAAGTLVISSDIPTSREILLDAAIFYPVEDYQALARTIERVSEDSAIRSDYIARGSEHVRKFSWDRCARETLEAYRNCMSAS